MTSDPDARPGGSAAGGPVVRGVVVAVAALLLALVGLVSGVAAVLVHADWWGLLLGLATTAAVLVFLGVRRWARPAFALGWVTALVVAMLPRVEGDYLVAGSLEGYLLLATVPVWVVAALTSVAGLGGRPRVAHDPG